MKRIITLVVIMLAMVSVAMGQKTSKEIDNMFFSLSYSLEKGGVKVVKEYGKGGRFNFDVGDYTLTRLGYMACYFEDKYDLIYCEGIEEYYLDCQPTEGEALKEHFERNRQYYNDKYGFIITDIDYWELGQRFKVEVFFPDWDKLQKEAAAKEKAKEQKRIESISW